ncbi:DUF1642 domain-containing protein [Streptococcus suis]|nr:DUF1642 domain-containing protein [Streptococcus suis]
MNKQEAIEKIYTASWDDPDYEGLVVNVETVNEIIYQIDEPQKVVVPKFVAEWYERNKDDLNTAIYSTIAETYRKVNGENDDLLDTFEGWLVYEGNSILILIQMQFFGYEVEQEKFFTVRIPDPNRPETVTYLYKENGKVFIGTDIFLDEVPNYKWKNEPENQLTESEIKQDFEWAWQWAEPVEVE